MIYLAVFNWIIIFVLFYSSAQTVESKTRTITSVALIVVFSFLKHKETYGAKHVARKLSSELWKPLAQAQYLRKRGPLLGLYRLFLTFRLSVDCTLTPQSFILTRLSQQDKAEEFTVLEFNVGVMSNDFYPRNLMYM